MRSELFGIELRYEDWNKQNELPLYISASYNFKVAYILDERCIILTPKEELSSLPTIRKQIQLIQTIDYAPIVFELDTLSFSRRKNFIDNRISFITNKQVFLPFIGTLLTNEYEAEKQIESFTTSTQQLFLAYMYCGKRKVYMSDISKHLPFSAMTLTRAVRQLKATNLFTMSKDGVNIVIEANYDRFELFEKIKKYLNSPITKIGYINRKYITEDMVIAGETYLSYKTMLNDGGVETYAIHAKKFDKNKVIDELIDPNQQVRIELWKYDPKLFSNDEFADSISVILSLKNNNDERVEEAIEYVMEQELNG